MRHERKHLPVLARIESVIERLKANKRAAIQAEAALDEAKKQATRSEDEVGQVVRRAEVLRERLHSGTSAARDLSAIQGEIDQLGQRQSALEEAQIMAMEALDSARQEAERLSRQESEIRTAGRELTAKRDAEFARLDEEIESLENQRADLAGTIETSLLADYEAVRTSTGGLGAVASGDAPLRAAPSRSAPRSWPASRPPRRSRSSTPRRTTSSSYAWTSDNGAS